MKRIFLALAVAAIPAAAQSVTVTLNGTTYTGTLTAQTPVTPISPAPTAAPQLPRSFMTPAWPLNQPATQYPAETRSLNSGNPFVPAPIVAGFMSTFGTNHIEFNTTMRITTVDTRQTPNLFAPVNITTNWGSDNEVDTTNAGVVTRTVPNLPVIGCHIEGATAALPNGPTGGDAHCLIYDAATGLLHELDGVSVTAGAYSANAYRRWNPATPQVGIPGQNSADAAGLPVLPLLLRYAEAAAGNIPHALRMTMNLTRANANGGPFTAPASHASGGNWGVMAYMGQRLYLRPDFPTTGFTPIELTVVKCLQTYGVVVADNGISGNIIADNDSHWGGGTNAAKLPDLSAMTLNDFILVNSGPIIDSTGEAAQ